MFLNAHMQYFEFRATFKCNIFMEFSGNVNKSTKEDFDLCLPLVLSANILRSIL